MQQMVESPASRDSKMASAAKGGGTKITLAFAPVSFDGLPDGVEDGDAFVILPALTRRHPCDHPGAAL